MTNKQRELIINEILKRAYDLRQTKGQEYASDEDVNAMFKRNRDLGISDLQCVGVFLDKHYQAIRNYIKTKRVLSESITERIVDMVNYLLILNSIIEENQEKSD